MWNLLFALFIVLGGVILFLFGLFYLGAKSYRLLIVKSNYSPTKRRWCFLFCGILFATGMWLACNAGNAGAVDIADLAFGAGLCAFHFGGAFGALLTY